MNHAEAPKRKSSKPPATDLDRPARRGPALLVSVLLVGALVAAVHWPVLRCQGLALDDDLFVTHNTLVRHPSWSSAGRFFGEVLNPSTVSAYYLPLSMTSLMLDCALGGRPDDLRVFHVTQLALHVLNTLLLLLILRRTFGSLVPAVMVGVLFGLHPLGVEPVASIGERKTLLATCFALASVWAWLRQRASGGIGARMLSLGFFALALLSKPSVTPLPLLLLLLDRWPLRRLSWRTFFEKWPFLGVAALFSAITVMTVARTWEFGTLPAADPLRAVLQVAYLIGFYAGKIAWPAHLSCVYEPPLRYALSEPAVAVGVGITAALGALLVLSARLGGGWLLGGLWFVLALAPTFGIIRWSSVIAYDRYLYFPGIGVAIAACAGFAAIWRLRGPGTHALRAALVAVVLVAAGAEARGTRDTLRPWKDSLSIWRHIVALAPRTPDSHNGLGATLEARYEDDEAIAEFRRAIEVDAGYGYAHLNLGAVLTDLGRPGEAIPHLILACERMPRSPGAAWVLGNAYKGEGRLDEAAAWYRRALEVRPGFTRALVQLGFIDLLQGRVGEGVDRLKRSVALAPQDGYARFGLGLGLLSVRGADTEVLGIMREAIRLDPESASPQKGLAWLLCTLPDSSLRDVPEALRLAARAAELTHRHDPDVLDTQGAALAAAGRFDEAIRSGEAALATAVRIGDDSLAAHIRKRIGEYRLGIPHREEVSRIPVRPPS